MLYSFYYKNHKLNVFPLLDVNHAYRNLNRRKKKLLHDGTEFWNILIHPNIPLNKPCSKTIVPIKYHKLLIVNMKIMVQMLAYPI